MSSTFNYCVFMLVPSNFFRNEIRTNQINFSTFFFIFFDVFTLFEKFVFIARKSFLGNFLIFHAALALIIYLDCESVSTNQTMGKQKHFHLLNSQFVRPKLSILFKKCLQYRICSIGISIVDVASVTIIIIIIIQSIRCWVFFILYAISSRYFPFVAIFHFRMKQNQNELFSLWKNAERSVFSVQTTQKWET